MSEDNIFVAILDALDPVIDEVVDVMGFPLNAIIAFLWGGIQEILREVLFG
jgi:hypothetical protein